MQGNVQLLLRAVALCGVGAALWTWEVERYGPPFWAWVLFAFALWLSFSGRPDGTRSQPMPAWSIVGLIGICAFAFALRWPALSEIPANISVDELLPALEAMRIAAGEAPNVFSSLGWFTIPNLSFAIPGVVMAWFPADTFFALRLSSLLTGLVGIVGTFLLARRLFGDGVALTAAFLMAAGFWHLHNSRTGFPFVQTSCAIPWVLYLLVRARQEQSAAGMLAAGLAMGLALQLYFPVRILLVLVPLFLVSGWVLRADPWSRRVRDGVLVVAGTLVTLGPMLASVPLDKLLGRSQGVLLTRPTVFAERARVYQTDEFSAVVGRNFQEAFGMFTEWADVCVLNRSPAGLFDVLTLTAILLGAAAAILRLHAQALILLAWIAVVFVLGVALTDAPRASYRLSAAMPAFYMLAAFGLHATLFSLRRGPRWYQSIALGVLATVVGAWVAHANHQMFFEDYSRRGQGRAMHPAAALRFVGERCDGRGIYFLAHPEPIGADETAKVFCAQHRSIRVADVPHAVDPDVAATFIVMHWRRSDLEHLRECYPAAVVVERHSEDGRLLFTSVDVEQEDVAAGPQRCRALEPETVDAPAGAQAAGASLSSGASPRREPRRAAPAPASRPAPPAGAAPR